MDADPSIDEFTALLERWRGGDDAARDAVVSVIHAEVETIASAILRRNHGPRSIVTNDLVNEAFLKLIQSQDVAVENRAHLLALCARIMRFVLVDSIRARTADKRHGDIVTLTGTVAEKDAVDATALIEALRRLQAISPERAQIVEMRYFGGMSLEDIGEVLGVSEATVKRSWAVTRAWLREALEHDIAR